MTENVMSEFLVFVGPFLAQLKWEYIVGFIFMTYVYGEVESQLNWLWIEQVKTRFKVAIIGLLYGLVFFYTKELEQSDLPALLISYLFSFGFHKLLVDSFIGVIQGRIGSFKSIAKGILKKKSDQEGLFDLKEPSADLADAEEAKKERRKKLALGVIDGVRKAASNPQVQRFVGGLLKGLIKR
jgi:hypothetical protein